jgi:hypothetical protein
MSYDFYAFTPGGGRVDHKTGLFEDGINQISDVFVILDDYSYPRLAHDTLESVNTAAQPSAMRELSPRIPTIQALTS